MNSKIGERLIINSYPANVVQEHIARYNFAAKHSKGKRVLDIACGTGYGSRILLDSGAKEVIGVDISSEAIAHSIENYKCDNLQFQIGDCRTIPFHDSSFDLVVSFETLEHIDCYNVFVEEVNRVLKTEGVFIVSSPNKAICSPNSEAPHNPYHLKEFTFTELQNLMSKHFKNIVIYGMRVANDKKGIMALILDKIPTKIKYILPLHVQTFLSRIFRKKINCEDVLISKEIKDDAVFFIAFCSNKIFL